MNNLSNTDTTSNHVQNVYPSYNKDDPTDPLNIYKLLVDFAIKYKDPVLHFPYVCKETRDIILDWLKQ